MSFHSPCLCFPAACCRRSVSGSSGSVCGSQETSPGLIWRTPTVASTLKPPSSTLLCPAPSACSWSDLCSRGENTEYVSVMCPCVIELSDRNDLVSEYWDYVAQAVWSNTVLHQIMCCVVIALCCLCARVQVLSHTAGWCLGNQGQDTSRSRT